MATEDTGVAATPAPRDRALGSRLLGPGVLIGTGALIGVAGLHGAWISGIGPALATALIAAAHRRPGPAIGIGAVFAAVAGLFLYWAAGASAGMAYAELRAFREGPWFSASLTAALGAFALVDHPKSRSAS